MRKSLLMMCNLLICFSLFAQAQTRITGVVSSAKDGTRVPATVTVKGTANGVTSNSNGAYAIDNVPANAVLVFSSIGFQPLEIAVNGRTVINAVLSESEQTLGEVIVVAYGTAKKGTYTGSASNISGDAIKNQPNTSFENGLIGRLPGVQVTSGSGQAGAAPNIRIRGFGSINASNEPLYVIDGVPATSGNVGQMGDYVLTSNNIMSTINPNDIESITILKDAAASSLYGSRAANGVVIITTKRGKTGKPSLNFKTSFGFTPTWATDNYETAGVQEQTNMLYRIFHDSRTSAGQTDVQANTYAVGQLNTRFNKHGYKFSTTGTGLAENVIISGMTDGVENREGRYFDWDKALFRTGKFQTNDLSVSGGNEQTNYYSSFSYTKDENRIRENDYNRISGRVNIGQKVGKIFEFITNINIARTKQQGFNDSRNTGANYFFQTRNLLFPFYWPTDYKTGQPYTARYGSLAQNNVYYDNQWENSSITRRITASENATLYILPSLNLRSIFSWDNSQIKEHLYYSPEHYNGSSTRGVVHDITTNYGKWVSSTTLNFNKQFGAHSLGLLGGFEAEDNVTDFQRSSGTDLPSSALHTAATAGKLDANAYEWGNSIMSVFSRAEYNYDQKYFASASIRRDGSSKLAPETRWGNFYSVAAAWKITGERFMKNLTAISNLRLRASYGTNGTYPTSLNGFRNLTSYASKYMDQPGGVSFSIGDPDVTWETSLSTNLALEFGLFGQRLTGTVEYFNRDSKDLLLPVAISQITGFSSILKNIGELNNRGVELELGGDMIRKNGWRWSASVNAAFIRSKVTELYRTPGALTGQEQQYSDPTGNDARAKFIYREGLPYLTFYGYEWAGVDPKNGNNVWYVNRDGDPGDFMFNGRAATNSFAKANQVTLGSALPKVYGGFNTDVDWKGINLALTFNYKIGGQIYDGAFKDVADDG